MSDKKMLRHTAFVSAVLTATGDFTAYLDCPFAPDEMKVKMAYFYESVAGVTSLQCVRCPRLTGMGNPPLCVVTTAMVSHVGLTWPLVGFTPGAYDFSVRKIDGTIDANLATSEVAFHIEFRKFV
jgi:hypothetical protein